MRGEGSSSWEIVAAAMKPREAAEYYALTLTATEDGKIVYDIFTGFVGWSDEKKLHEIRAARLVNPNIFRVMNEPFVAVHDLNELSVFFAIGGHALIEQGFADAELSDLLSPELAVPDGWIGYKSASLADPGAFTYAPSPKLRMRVLKRDRRRCRICGRGPEHSTDIQLRVHHIRPFALGGLTEERNLLTLCHTCHDGLDPHWDRELAPLVQPLDFTSLRDEFRLGVEAYRRRIAEEHDAESLLPSDDAN